MSKISVNIRNFRESKGMSVEELALKVRCGTKTIENYENGTATPNLDTILKISTALDVPANEFLDEKTHKPI
ncbi:helix-turn-helix domain-containing protein [Peribacillus faecalis]|uniref:helix-turn-helix domain-containing protein n=1 Tax=Peribacillus faecalis TaxID=2772559 RepID=UPI001F455E03|nr:helix-turn-helix transcriptional regulator [Peribacillus faecalis]